MTYRVISKLPLTIGNKQLRFGNTFEPIDDRDWVRLIKLGLIEELKAANVEASNDVKPIETLEEKPAIEPAKNDVEPENSSKNDLTNAENNGIVEIVEVGAGWLQVHVDGEQVGKSTRDREEAEKLASEWR